MINLMALIDKVGLEPTTARRIICLAEAILSFVIACFAAPHVHCYLSGLEPFGYCATLSFVFTFLSLLFLIPSLVLWFHVRAGVIAQLMIPLGVAWVLFTYA